MERLSIIKRPIEGEFDDFVRLFNESLSHTDGLLSQVLEHIRHRGGKRMRPLLILLIAKNYGGVNDVTLRSAVGLELLHTASLVHDDVVDESNERRGQASLHKVYDNKVAVLLGDYMLALSLHQAALTQQVEIVEDVAKLGATLSEGEILQLVNVEREELSEEAYFSIIRNKTSALFTACGNLGAMAQRADGDYCRKAAKFGEIVGLCFQIRDDIFDYYDDASIGKPRGNDMREGKLTLPVIYAVNHSGDVAARELAYKVKRFEATAEDIALLIEFTKENGGIEYARQTMEYLRVEAVDLVSEFRNKDVRQALERYIDFVIGRDF